MNPIPEERVAAARARMAELREKFIERTQGEVQLMQRSLASLEAGDSSALGTIVQLAHRMTGTGATLGLEALSDRAQHIEKLGDAQPPGAGMDRTTLGQLRAAVGALAAELERTPRAG